MYKTHICLPPEGVLYEKCSLSSFSKCFGILSNPFIYLQGTYAKIVLPKWGLIASVTDISSY